MGAKQDKVNEALAQRAQARSRADVRAFMRESTDLLASRGGLSRRSPQGEEYNDDDD